MVKENKSPENQGSSKTKRPLLCKAAIVGLVLVFLIGISGVWVLVYNNVSVVSDVAFANRIDTAIELAEEWVKTHKMDILEKKNAALLKK